MSRVLYRVGRACFAHRWLVVAIWLVVVFAAGTGMKISGGQLDNTFTIPGSPSQTALDQVKNDFPTAGGTSAQLVFQATGGTTVTSPPNAAAISQALAKAAAAPQVTAVIPPQKSHLVSKDGTTAIATVQTDRRPRRARTDRIPRGHASWSRSPRQAARPPRPAALATDPCLHRPGPGWVAVTA